MSIFEKIVLNDDTMRFIKKKNRHGYPNSDAFIELVGLTSTTGFYITCVRDLMFVWEWSWNHVIYLLNLLEKNGIAMRIPLDETGYIFALKLMIPKD